MGSSIGTRKTAARRGRPFPSESAATIHSPQGPARPRTRPTLSNRLRNFLLIPLSCLISLVLSAEAADRSATLQGFSAEAACAERNWENKFRAIPEPANLRAYMQRLTAHPHQVGSPYDKQNAEWILSKFKAWGWRAHIEEFEVLFPTPRERLVELIAPQKYTARLEEPPLPGDPSSRPQAEELPPYNAYSADGDVTAPLVYVNYGVPDDYVRLERLGVSVKGAIVIARYGHSWRGIKPKVAAEHGAVGCLLYSDPEDDGYSEGDVFPKGSYRPPQGVQRGSVLAMPVYPGDPLTPGIGATTDARRLLRDQAATLAKIPTLPLSYGDAQPLLAALGGPVAPYSWRGGLPVTYHLGPGPAKVHLKALFNWGIKPIYDVIARIPGATDSDQWVIRGNHHDAWVYGAEDPSAAMVAELEEARALGELLKQGWKPRRTILYCAWDGEEPGLMGSTEWAEEHAADLSSHAVAYLNTDTNDRGYLFASGSQTLTKFENDVQRDVEDPEAHVSIWKRSQLSQIRWGSDSERKEARTKPDLRLGAPGSGSDHTVFLNHLGIASLNIGFAGETGIGIYHSAYDDYYWYTHFSDTDFRYGRALAQLMGTAVMRLADAELLPFDFSDLAQSVHRYIDNLKKILKDDQDEAREQNKEIAEGVYTLTADPQETFDPPSVEQVPPYLNFAPLDNAEDALTRAAEHYQNILKQAQANGGTALDAASLHLVNATLIDSERRVITPEGLPGRSWFKHQLYAPGFYTGYGVKPLPAVREAIEQKDWKGANEASRTLGRVLQSEADLINTAANQLEKALP